MCIPRGPGSSAVVVRVERGSREEKVGEVEIETEEIRLVRYVVMWFETGLDLLFLCVCVWLS